LAALFAGQVQLTTKAAFALTTKGTATVVPCAKVRKEALVISSIEET